MVRIYLAKQYMQKLTYYLRKYPNRIKYGLILLDIFAMIIAIRVYVNYLSIETAIENTTFERQTKMAELAFSQNFLVHYEKSEYAKYFLQHENNMLSQGEYIIKFEENTKKTATGDVETTTTAPTPTDSSIIRTPQAGRKKFLNEMIK